ncbi:MAG: hypothetical protein Q9165_005565 [Trypethelium subeluteriae]
MVEGEAPRDKVRKFRRDLSGSLVTSASPPIPPHITLYFPIASIMPGAFAPYAVACSRGENGCQRCKGDNIVCTYSRSGVIRRRRKRKREVLVRGQTSPDVLGPDHGAPEAGSSTLQSHLATEIEETRGQLRETDTSQMNSLGALSSLSEACAAVWHDASDFEKTGHNFFLFEDRAVGWVDGTHSH